MAVEPVWNARRALFEAGSTETHLIDILPMLLNHRIVLTPKQNLTCYDAGWCYSSEEAAFQAVRQWRPEVEPEPPGYTKRVI